MLAGFPAAVGFLTILPVGRTAHADSAKLGRSVAAFPLVGLLQGAVLALLAWGSSLFVPQGLAAALVLAAHVLLSGAFHLDGLSDTFDALAKHGDTESRLAAMKDPASGAAGVTAVVFSVLIKYLALVALMGLYPAAVFHALVVMPVAAKWAMVVSMLHGRPARKEGLGKLFIEGTGVREFAVATVTTFAVITLSAMSFGAAVLLKHVLSAVVLAVVYVLTLLFNRTFTKRFGGLTGDTVGATAELMESITLIMLVIWSGLYIS